MNVVSITGRLTQDVKVGNNFARYSIAVPRRFKRDGEPDADFLNVVCFGKQAEFATKYLSKGMMIGVTGHIQTGTYTGRDGATRHSFDIVAEQHDFLEKKSQGASQSVSQGFEDASQVELPFV